MQAKTPRFIRLIAGVSLTLAIAGCAATSYNKEIALEAHWQCDVHHRTYADLSEMEPDLANRLASEGVSATRYAEFKAAMEDSPELRSETLAAYEAYCGLASDDCIPLRLGQMSTSTDQGTAWGYRFNDQTRRVGCPYAGRFIVRNFRTRDRHDRRVAHPRPRPPVHRSIATRPAVFARRHP